MRLSAPALALVLMSAVIESCAAVTIRSATQPAAVEPNAAPVTSYDIGELDRTPGPIPTHHVDAVWSAPSDMDAEREAYVRAFFESFGMPDPRGLPLHHVRLRDADITDASGRSYDTLGFVLPERAGQTPRFVIAPNGFVYAAEAIGPSASPDDLPRGEGDADALITFAWDLLRWRVGVPVDVEAEECRRGFCERDEEALARARAALPTGLARYGSTLAHWVWHRIERGLTAHMRGDDALALHDMQLADGALTEHASLFVDLPPQTDWREWHSDIVQPVLADQHRRANPPEEASTDIASLIDSLEDVAVAQGGWPGGVMLSYAPAVEALIGLGDEVVEPMLRVLQEDTRLTRCVHFLRPWSFHRQPISVSEAAYAVLANVLQVDFFQSRSTSDSLSARDPAGRRALHERIATFWRHYRRFEGAARDYAILSNDDELPVRWLDAGARLAAPAGQSDGEHGSMFGSVLGPDRPVGPSAPAAGAELLGSPEHDLLGLVERRVQASFAGSEGGDVVCGLTGSLLELDESAGRDLAERTLRYCEGTACWCTPQLFAILAESSGMGRRYISWLRHASPSDPRVARQMILPAREYGSRVERFVRALVQGPLWNTLLTDEVPHESELDFALRAAWVHALRRTERAADWHITDEGRLHVQFSNSRSRGAHCPEPCPPPGTRGIIRYADERLSRGLRRGTQEGQGMEFRVTWPVERRDAAILALISRLEGMDGAWAFAAQEEGALD